MRERAGSTGSRLEFHESATSLPEILDVAIVATGAAARKGAISKLLSGRRIRYLVLEKVLFQTVADCFWAQKLFSETGTQAWVNFPRRIQPAYARLRSMMVSPEPREIRVTGSRWGLATSALHFLDLALFLGGGDEISIETFEAQTFASPRHEGHLECTGFIAGGCGPGKRYSISSWEEGSFPVCVAIDTLQARWIVEEHEHDTVTLESTRARAWAWETVRHPFFYQSELTASVVEELLSRGGCGLSGYRSALQSHVAFLRAWNRGFAPTSDPDLTPCPIT